MIRGEMTHFYRAARLHELELCCDLRNCAFSDLHCNEIDQRCLRSCMGLAASSSFL